MPDIQTDNSKAANANADAKTRQSKEDRQKQRQERDEAREKARIAKLAKKGMPTIADVDAMINPKKNRGRPTTYSEEMRDRICMYLANGITMARICQTDGMPAFDTVWKWTMRHPDFAEATARAREIGTHYLADDCIRISDDPELDPADKRVMIDTRVRLIGKWNQYYSDRQQVLVAGKIDVQPIDVNALDFDQRDALASMLEAVALPGPDQDDL
jgi:phospholipase/lecithinase/hemolysin